LVLAHRLANRYPKRNELYDDINFDDTAFPVHPASSPSPPPFITNVGDFRAQTPPNNNLSFYESTSYGQHQGNMNANMNTGENINQGYGQNYGQFGGGFGDIMNNPATGYLVGMGMNQVTQNFETSV
jgi:hypothetical protein